MTFLVLPESEGAGVSGGDSISESKDIDFDFDRNEPMGLVQSKGRRSVREGGTALVSGLEL